MDNTAKYISKTLKNNNIYAYNTEAAEDADFPVVVYALSAAETYTDIKRVYKLEINIYTPSLQEITDTNTKIINILETNTIGFNSGESYRIFDVLATENVFLADRNLYTKQITANIYVI